MKLIQLCEFFLKCSSHVLTICSIADELHEDSKEAIGADKVEWRVIEGGHEFPIASPDKVVKEIAGIWGI